MNMRSQAPVNLGSETVIAAGTIVVGDIIFSGRLRIDGEVTGDVSGAEGQLTTLAVGESGRVDGSVEVTDAVIHGTLIGNVCATGQITIFSKAQLNSDVTYAGLEMHLGAIIHGRLGVMDAN